MSGDRSVKKVLMGCTHAFTSTLQVGSQHIARCFAAEGWDVWYLSAPVTVLHALRLHSPDVRKRCKSAILDGWQRSGTIQHRIPFSLYAPDGNPVLSHPVVTGSWHNTIFPRMKSVIKAAGEGAFDLLYIDNLSYHFLADYIPHRRCVFRVMDVHDAFPGWKGRARSIASKIASKADSVVYSARGLEPYVESLSPRSMEFMPNGVSSAFFTEVAPSQRLRGMKGPFALYSGSLDSRVDYTLLGKAAKALPDVQFILAGPVAPDVELPEFPVNVHWIGPVPHSELPALMRACHVGLIPFNVRERQELISGIRPLKMLEYMASGLPVVCADWPEVRMMESPAFVYQDFDGFVRLIDEFANGQTDKDGVKYAASYTWERVCRCLTDQHYL